MRHTENLDTKEALDLGVATLIVVSALATQLMTTVQSHVQ